MAAPEQGQIRATGTEFHRGLVSDAEKVHGGGLPAARSCGLRALRDRRKPSQLAKGFTPSAGQGSPLTCFSHQPGSHLAENNQPVRYAFTVLKYGFARMPFSTSTSINYEHGNYGSYGNYGSDFSK
eukprot:scaffold342035_cov37-Prasinocladus_malaysianus.AAC.2